MQHASVPSARWLELLDLWQMYHQVMYIVTHGCGIVHERVQRGVYITMVGRIQDSIQGSWHLTRIENDG